LYVILAIAGVTKGALRSHFDDKESVDEPENCAEVWFVAMIPWAASFFRRPAGIFAAIPS
jgi:AcrR family transcriptional regulator